MILERRIRQAREALGPEALNRDIWTHLGVSRSTFNLHNLKQRRRAPTDSFTPRELVLLLLKDEPEFGYGQSVTRGVEQIGAYTLAYSPTLAA